MNKLPNYGCLLSDTASKEDRIRDLEIFARYVAKIERNRCELEALRVRDKFGPNIFPFVCINLEELVKKIRQDSEFEDIRL